MTSDSQLVVCHKCGNLWPYSGSRRRATCPSCNVKVRVEEMQVETIYDAVDQLVDRLDRQEEKLRARRETYGQMRQRVPEVEDEIDRLNDRIDDLVDVVYEVADRSTDVELDYHDSEDEAPDKVEFVFD